MPNNLRSPLRNLGNLRAIHMLAPPPNPLALHAIVPTNVALLLDTESN